MKAWFAILILIVIAVLAYFRVITFDPITYIMLGILLYQTHVLMQRQQQQVDAYVKMHGIVTKNQKAIHDEIKGVRSEIRKLPR